MSSAVLVTRLARASDRSALTAMVERCSAPTRSRRFHAPLRAFPEPYLTGAVSGRADHIALVAEVAGDVVALGSCCVLDAHSAELGVLVEDRYQRQGIGGRLVEQLVGHVDRAGLRTLRASVSADQRWILRLLRRYGPTTGEWDFGVVDVTVHREAS